MSMPAKRNATLLQVALLAAGLFGLATAALAQQDDDRCTGTLCDYYYGSPGSDSFDAPKKQAAAPTPLTVPKPGVLSRLFSGGDAQPAAPGTPAAPAKRPLIGVGGGGLASLARGEKQERCSGTLCDLFYGGPAPEKPAEATVAATPDAVAAEPVPEPETRRVEMVEPRETTLCAGTARDPWKCYR